LALARCNYDGWLMDYDGIVQDSHDEGESSGRPRQCGHSPAVRKGGA
jgi:hypothetical protein